MNYLDYLSGSGQDVFRNILNASVGWTFLKKQLEVRLEAFDILNAGSVYSMTLTPEAMTQVWTPYVWSQYNVDRHISFQKKVTRRHALLQGVLPIKKGVLLINGRQTVFFALF